MTKSAAGTSPAWIDPDDAPELTDELFDQGEVFQGETFVRRVRGRPPTGKAKEHVSVRLDQDVLARLRLAGPGWQSQINMLLRAALALGDVDYPPKTGNLERVEETVQPATDLPETAAARSGTIIISNPSAAKRRSRKLA